MGFFKNFFPEKRTQLSDHIESEDKYLDSESRSLYTIQEILKKLELINYSRGETEYLTKQIEKYKEKLSSILVGKIEKKDWMTTEDYNKRTHYLLSLSYLSDELSTFSKTYFYLEDLHVFQEKTITRSNILEMKKQIIELEQKIVPYHDTNKGLDSYLHSYLSDIIYNLLKHEAVFSSNYSLYQELTRVSQLEMNKLFLNELLHESQYQSNSFIQNYIKENDINDICFDYNILLELTSLKQQIDNITEIAIKEPTNTNLVSIQKKFVWFPITKMTQAHDPIINMEKDWLDGIPIILTSLPATTIKLLSSFAIDLVSMPFRKAYYHYQREENPQETYISQRK